MPLKPSPLSRYAVPHSLKVPLLGPPTEVVVVKTAPNPVAVPSQVNWLRTLPAGPGQFVIVVNLNENSPIDLPNAIRLCLSILVDVNDSTSPLLGLLKQKSKRL